MDIFQAMYMKDMEALDAILRSGADLQTVCEHKDMYDFEGKSPSLVRSAGLTAYRMLRP